MDKIYSPEIKGCKQLQLYTFSSIRFLCQIGVFGGDDYSYSIGSNAKYWEYSDEIPKSAPLFSKIIGSYSSNQIIVPASGGELVFDKSCWLDIERLFKVEPSISTYEVIFYKNRLKLYRKNNFIGLISQLNDIGMSSESHNRDRMFPYQDSYKCIVIEDCCEFIGKYDLFPTALGIYIFSENLMTYILERIETAQFDRVYSLEL